MGRIDILGVGRIAAPVRVRAICGHCREERELREGNLNDEELENEKFIREMNEKELQTFRDYQQGTEDLIP